MTTTPTVNDLATWERFRAATQAALLAGADEHVERLSWRAEQVASAQRDGLRRLLAHAVEHSPFHRQRLAGIDIDGIEPGDLPALPVMTKAEMMADLDAVVADRRLTRAALEEALVVTGTEPIPVLDEYIALASGGSSGERGIFVFDPSALASVVLSLTRSLLARLRAIGGPPPGGFPITMVAAGSAVHATGMASALSAGQGLPFGFISVPVTLPVAEIVERLNALQAPALFGYASILARLATEKRAGRLEVSPLVVTSTSETLLPEVRAAITEAFGVPVVDTFGSTEGLSGTTLPGEPVMTFNSDMCIIELVGTDNRPVPPGTPSAKVLLTNLYNLAQPLIRYELTDSFVREPDAPEHGHLRARVRGRSDEVLHYGVVDVHPLVLRSVLVKEPHVVDYQVRQTATGADVDAVCSGFVDADVLAGRIASALVEAGLPGPKVTVRIVDGLDRHHHTGKLRRFLPLGG